MRAYVARFHPHERSESSVVEIVVRDIGSGPTGRVTIDPDWKRPYRNDKGNGAIDPVALPSVDIRWVRTRATFDCSTPRVTDRETKPPPRYTMTTPMVDLVRVAKYVTEPRVRDLLIARDKAKKGEHGGIGTPATRSAIIAGSIR